MRWADIGVSLTEKIDAMTDALFTRAFERGEVPPAEFDHRAHMRVAWVYLREFGSRDRAIDRMREQIQWFAARAGASQKYHETITVAWMALLDQARAALPAGAELAEAVHAYPALADKDLPLRFYSRPLLFSEAARARWIAPDLAPLDADGGPASGPPSQDITDSRSSA
jgi:hypothetical protein